MSLRQRLIKSEKALPNKIKKQKKELNPVVLWLIENNEEFRECFKQLYRLRRKAEQDTFQWEQGQEPYREQAKVLINHLNQLIMKHEDEAMSRKKVKTTA